jgi:hypothetical protein
MLPAVISVHRHRVRPCKGSIRTSRNRVHSPACSPTSFARAHETLRVTAMAGVADRLGKVADIVALVEAAEVERARAAPDKEPLAPTR